MSVFKPNLDKFSSKVFVAPKDDYEVEIAVPKLRVVPIKNGKNAGSNMVIINIPVRIARNADGDTEYQNKPMNLDFIINEGEDESFNRVIRFIMCANGIRPGSDEADEEFRTRFGDLDLSVDVEAGTLGAGYATLQKKFVVVTVDVTSRGDQLFQKYLGARPL